MGKGRQMIGKIKKERELCKAEIVTTKDPVMSVVHCSDDSKADPGWRAQGEVVAEWLASSSSQAGNQEQVQEKQADLR